MQKNENIKIDEFIEKIRTFNYEERGIIIAELQKFHKDESIARRPFGSIRTFDTSLFLDFIQNEHPQTIALILAYLEPQEASVILLNLHHEIQSDVARRIALFDPPISEVIREVEHVLNKKLSSLLSKEDILAGGVPGRKHLLFKQDRIEEIGVDRSFEYLPFGT